MLIVLFAFWGLSAAAVIPQTTGCNGSSADLPAAECAAWQDLYDGLQGALWNRGCRENRYDPCACYAAPCSRVISGLPSTSPPPETNITSNQPQQQQQQQQQQQLLLLHITQLTLNQHVLRGTLPPSIGALTELTVLYLDTNHICGAIPRELRRLTKLTALRLDGNLFNGTVPPLPFAQYADVCGIGGQTQPAAAEGGAGGGAGEGGGFACPLPPGAAACNYNSENVTCG